ncbi:MAG: cupin domain-containing protein [Mailhella sp.]|nr:cupin domain-containing protein [Mailhella sp.]
MIIPFHTASEEAYPSFKGGEKELSAKMFFDGANRILWGRLVPGATIGLHTHENDCEAVYVLEGEGVFLYDGTPESAPAGACHYCPKGHSHSLSNALPDKDLVFFAVVPRQ